MKGQKIKLVESGIKKIVGRYMNESKLLGTSPTLERITSLISKYYYGSTITLTPNDDGTYDVHNLKGKIDGVRVVQKGNKFRFERM